MVFREEQVVACILNLDLLPSESSVRSAAVVENPCRRDKGGGIALLQDPAAEVDFLAVCPEPFIKETHPVD